MPVFVGVMCCINCTIVNRYNMFYYVVCVMYACNIVMDVMLFMFEEHFRPH